MARFKKGTSGNPKGKPTGTKDKRTELRELLKPHADALVKVAVEKALEGGTTALRLCIDKLIPSVKAVSLPVKLDIPAEGTLTEQVAGIYQATIKGKIATDEAAALVGILQGQARITELVELEQRLATIEERLGTKP